MSFEFTENVGITLPNIDQKTLTEFAEADNNNQKLVVEIAAIHAGLTANFNNYPADELEASLRSWVDPYPKPIIINHDPESDPLGRVMAARMDKEKDGTPFSRLQIAVINSEAISKVMDGRFITGSVGGKAESAKCSICNTDWAKSTEGFALPCKHKRGQIYNGKLAFFNLSGLEWREYSFVNIPADKKSGVLNDGGNTSSDESAPEWIKSAKLFAVNMSEEKILELTESEEPRNILSGLKKKDAHYTYMNVKGTFLTASAYDYEENMDTNITFDETITTIDNEPRTQDTGSTKEVTEMQEGSEMSTQETEDILSIAEQLSADLASTDAEVTTEEASETDQADNASDELSESSDEETAPEETAVETKEDGDKDSDDSTAVEEQLSEVQVEDSTEEQAEQNESTEVDHVNEEQVHDEKDDVIASLKQENDKLKKALHFMLAERVVDTKISLGLVELADRQEALNEHSNRTAASLADAIRDLEKLSVSRNIPFAKESIATPIVPNALATVDESERVIEEGETDNVKLDVSPQEKLENILVNQLLNRK